jgi:hypothetical protein
MTAVTIEDGRVEIEMLGWDKLWALKGRVSFPVAHVTAVRRWEKGRDRSWPAGLRMPGTCIVGLIVAGTYWCPGRRDFYAVHAFDRALIFELRDEPYQQVVVEVADPDETLAQIRAGNA